MRKSKYDENGIRFRHLTVKRGFEKRWRTAGVEETKPKYFRAYIYRIEEAEELGIEFRTDWRELNNNIEILDDPCGNPNVVIQPNDWVLTDTAEPDGEFWVMQVLFRNTSKNFPYIRTAVGSFGIRSSSPLTAHDFEDGTVVSRKVYGSGELNGNQIMLARKIADGILDTGLFSPEIVRVAYAQVYNTSKFSNSRVMDIMSSEKIMKEVAKNIAEAAQRNGADLDFVFEQLKDMGSKDYDRLPERRLQVVQMIASANDPNFAAIEAKRSLPQGQSNPMTTEDSVIEADFVDMGLDG